MQPIPSGKAPRGHPQLGVTPHFGEPSYGLGWANLKQHFLDRVDSRSRCADGSMGREGGGETLGANTPMLAGVLGSNLVQAVAGLLQAGRAPAMAPKVMSRLLPERAPWEGDRDSSDEEGPSPPLAEADEDDDDLASVVSESDEEVAELSAGEELVAVLQHLLLMSGISAYYFCLICY